MNVQKGTSVFDKEVNIKSDKIESDGYYTEKIKLYPSDEQKNILLLWMKYYTKMYNETIRYFRICEFNGEKINFSLGCVKKILRNPKENIINQSKNDGYYAINDALNRLQACITNLRLRYIKLTKEKKIIKFEKLAFRENGFCLNMLGNMKCCKENYNYLENIETLATVVYNKRNT